MNNIKFGLKLWSTNHNLLEETKELIKRDLFHYIELLVIPNTEILSFQKVKVPYIVHIASDGQGVNIADKDKEKFNLKVIKQCIQWGNKLGAKYLILHPGFGEIEVARKFLERINDKRILIENMPKVGINGEKMIGFTPEQIKELIGNKFGFCLDFNHAIKAAISLKMNLEEYIKDFLKLDPKILHISDGILKNEKDEHLNIGKGEYGFQFLVNCIKESRAKYITLETPRVNSSSLKEDLKNLKILNTKIPTFLVKKIIKLGTEKILKETKTNKPIIVEIKKDNIASQKAFSKAGYKFIKK